MRQHLEKIRERGRVFEGMGRIGVEEPAAVGAQLFDGDLGGGWADCNGLGGDGRDCLRPASGWIRLGCDAG